MSRTGSGKSAGFIIPMIEKLKGHSTIVGVRAIIISPTRELAMQTDSFARKLSSFTDLRICRLIGGDALEPQFTFLSKNPDIIIGTPSRVLHILHEANLSLKNVEMVVLDEGDRLFEKGLAIQTEEILRKCPNTRQMVVVSATLPQSMVKFVNSGVGLRNPIIVRLDQGKLSDTLKMSFFVVKRGERLPCLIHLVRRVINQKPLESSLIFVPTRHHVELLKMIFDSFHLKSSICYGTMFAEQRKDNIRRFRAKETKYLIVTDLAARGIDIPFLNNVVNFNFPAQAKLFVHRVGRAARAGKSGTAYSIVLQEELGYLAELKQLLGDRVQFRFNEDSLPKNDHLNNYVGRIPQVIIDQEMSEVNRILASEFSIKSQADVCERAYKKYKKISREPTRKATLVSKGWKIGIHPLMLQGMTKNMIEEMNSMSSFKQKVSGYKPRATVFEMGEFKGSEEEEVMKRRRVEMQFLKRFKPKILVDKKSSGNNYGNMKPMTLSSQIRSDFTKQNFKDENNFVAYQRKNTNSEKLYRLEGKKTFGNNLKDESFNIVPEREVQGGSSKLIWDKRSGKYKRIHLSNGERLGGGMKKKGKFSNGERKNFRKWKKKTKGRIQNPGEMEESFGVPVVSKINRLKQLVEAQGTKRGRINDYELGLKSNRQISVDRARKQKRKAHEKIAQKVKRNKRFKTQLHYDAMDRAKRKREEQKNEMFEDRISRPRKRRKKKR